MSILLELDRKQVIAHRGGRAHAPENTIEAMRLGIADGADALELDVRLSADGEVVVIHDPTVDRTTNKTGEVQRMTLAELRSLDAGCRFRGQSGIAAEPATHRIPTLDEVLSAFPQTPVLIEIKAPLAAAPTRRLIEKHGAQSRCLVDGYSSIALQVFRGSRIARGPGQNGIVEMLAKSLAGASSPVPDEVGALSLPPTYYGVPLPLRHFVRMMRSAGKPTHIWTVNDPAEARKLWALGVSGIITDDVRAILPLRS